VELSSAVPFGVFLGDILAQPRLNTLLLAVFAGAALLVAAIGLFGLLATMIRQRTHELGVRMALGATSGDLRRMIVSRGVLIAGIGAAIGLAGAALANRLVVALLYEVTPTDGITLVAVTVLLLIVAGCASFAAARASTRIDPAIALRAE
jgi:putative ABC transport system permease protein